MTSKLLWSNLSLNSAKDPPALITVWIEDKKNDAIHLLTLDE